MDSGNHVHVEDPYYIPGLRKNLFSIEAITSKNMKVFFDNKKIEVYNDRLLVTGIKQSNQCYKILFKTVVNNQANVSTSNTIMLWHERMGHVNFRTLKEMADDGRIPGLQIKNFDGLFCETCQYGMIISRCIVDHSTEFENANSRT